MSDTVDNVMNSVQDQDPDDATGVYVDDSPSSSEAEEPAEEPVEEPAEEPAEEPVVEPEPAEEPVVEEPVVEPAATEDPVSTQEVVQNVQEILSSTETNVTVDNSELEERVKVLEERLEKIIITIKSYSPKMEKELLMIL